MKCVIFGKGLIGKMQGRILVDEFECEIKFFRSQGPASDPEDISTWEAFESFAPDFALMANPTHLHIESAIACAQRNVPLFIEKPFDCSLNRLAELQEIVREKNLSTYVAYCLRFHPGLNYLKTQIEEESPLFVKVHAVNHLPSWDRHTDSRETYSAYIGQGGGVLYDLSHEIDYVYHLFGDLEFTQHRLKKTGQVTVDAPDRFLASFASGETEGMIYLDYFSHRSQRCLQVDFTDRSLYMPLKEMKVEEYRNREKTDTIEFAGAYTDMYIDQLKYFIQHLGEVDLMNNVFEAEKVLRQLVTLHEQNGFG